MNTWDESNKKKVQLSKEQDVYTGALDVAIQFMGPGMNCEGLFDHERTNERTDEKRDSNTSLTVSLPFSTISKEI